MKRAYIADDALDILDRGSETVAPPPSDPVREWPAPIINEAFHGLAGEFVNLVGPETEADAAALLYQFLAVSGCYIGRGPYFKIGGTRHYPSLFVIIAAESSRGRKGTSLGEILRLYGLIDHDWLAQRRVGGLSTGEGLLWAVRDPIVETVPIREGRRVVDRRLETTDFGVSDKRLLVVESEFAQALQAASRDGSTLSALIRQAWDGGPLRVLAKNAKASCLEPHVAIIGHITIAELRSLLSSNDSVNGFANRFCWVCSSRSKYLPFGGCVDEKQLELLAGRVADAARFARSAGRMDFAPDAREAWVTVYPTLSEGHQGLLGAVTARAEAQALRLAMIYALLDSSASITTAHLRAALAAWEYVENSAKFIFGESVGDPTAEAIRLLLTENPDGIKRSAVNDHFQRHKKSTEIGDALSKLRGLGLAKMESQPTAGRPVEIWYPIQPVTGNGKQ